MCYSITQLIGSAGLVQELLLWNTIKLNCKGGGGDSCKFLVTGALPSIHGKIQIV